MTFLARLKRAARPLAIMGCVCIGVVYVLVGVLALLALAGVFTGSADETRMVQVVMDLPAGAVVVWAVVLGLLGYIVWRTIEAIADPHEFGSDLKGLVQRGGSVLGALGYGILVWSAARIAMGDGTHDGESNEASQQHLVGRVLEWTGGEWLIAAAGIVVLVVAVAQLVLMAGRGYARDVALEQRSPRVRAFIHFLAMYGHASRAAILGVFGYFFITSALTLDPSAVGDTDTAFDFIGGGIVGDSAFLVVAVGTIAYGLFMFACARYYDFQPRSNA
jgi:hypothetical protein